MQKNSGFTIVEVMIVVAIMAIVASIAVPNMLGSRSDAKLRGAVANLKGDLNTAKMMAVRENALVVVNFFGNGYQVFVDNGAGANSGDCTLNADERSLVNRSLPAGVTIDLATSTFADNRTRYNRRGLPQNLGIVVVEDLTGAQRQLELNRLGRIEIQ